MISSSTAEDAQNADKEMLQIQIGVVLMSKMNVWIWNREFNLDISYQNFPGEDITENQRKILTTVSAADYDTAKVGVERYIKKVFASELGNDNLDNIFRFVMPRSILVPRTETSSVFAILCNFKFDMEHGIAIIFEDGKYKKTGSQDLIL